MESIITTYMVCLDNSIFTFPTHVCKEATICRFIKPRLFYIEKREHGLKRGSKSFKTFLLYNFLVPSNCENSELWKNVITRKLSPPKTLRIFFHFILLFFQRPPLLNSQTTNFGITFQGSDLTVSLKN